jgi:hypothetical protein
LKNQTEKKKKKKGESFTREERDGLENEEEHLAAKYQTILDKISRRYKIQSSEIIQ